MNRTAMMNCLLVAGLGGAGLLMTGCDWTSGGGVNDFNTGDVNIQVSGVYRAANPGDPIVTDFSSRAEAPSTGPASVSDERIATGNGSSTVFSGSFNNNNIVAGSVLISGAGYSFSDNGDGTLTGAPAGSGSVSYESGGFSVDFAGIAPSSGDALRASYQHTVTSEDAPVESGASATTIYTFNVEQIGNRIRITDNNGDAYEGQISSSRVESRSTVAETQEGDTETTEQDVQSSVQFSAEGSSRGIPVRIVGVFNIQSTEFFSESISITQSEASLSQESFAVIRSLTLDGTWIEPGAQGDIQAFGPAGQRVEIADSP